MPTPSFPDLDDARRAFRDNVERAGAAAVIAGFTGRIGLVLSGGGARGAYEAGALLAFQDAGVPTHIITTTSIGSVNAASYVAASSGLVGNAESLIASWLELTPDALGIEWTRYGWMTAGVIAISAGVGNLAWYLLTLAGVEVHLHYPALAWGSLALAGIALLLFHPQLPAVWFWLRSRMKGGDVTLTGRRVAQSIGANLLVGLFLTSGTLALHLHTGFATIVRRHPLTLIGILAGLFVLQRLQRRYRRPLGRAWEWLVQLALDPGLFKNFERSRYLRARIAADRLGRSPIRLIFTATDLAAEEVRHFANVPPEVLAADPGADPAFARTVTLPADPMLAIVASSALPITYEPIAIEGRALADGAVMGSQPVRPAIRLGADVLFLVLLAPAQGPPVDVATFVDVGTRALGILMHQHLRADLAELTQMNRLCEDAARRLGGGVRPEEVTIELGERRLRYIRTFVIRPDHPLGLSIHDFGGPGTREAILAGYRDAAKALAEFVDYARTARFGRPRRTMEMIEMKEG